MRELCLILGCVFACACEPIPREVSTDGSWIFWEREYGESGSVDWKGGALLTEGVGELVFVDGFTERVNGVVGAHTVKKELGYFDIEPEAWVISDNSEAVRPSTNERYPVRAVGPTKTQIGTWAAFSRACEASGCVLVGDPVAVCREAVKSWQPQKRDSFLLTPVGCFRKPAGLDLTQVADTEAD